MNTFFRPLQILLIGLKWKLFCWQLYAEQDKNTRTPDDERLLRSAELRSCLRRVPYWASGHLELAVESLASNDIDTAYASAQAVQVLRGTREQIRRSKQLVARCQLKRGSIEAARAGFSTLLVEAPEWHSAREDLAALHVMQGDFQAALGEYEKIPAGKLSPEAHAAIQFTRQKLS